MPSYKRRAPEGTTKACKKSKITPGFSLASVDGISPPICFPMNQDGFRYYLVEKENSIFNRDSAVEGAAGGAHPGYIYRVFNYPTVTISPNDRAHQLTVSEDRLSVRGNEGYCVARATHSVCHGAWYFEVFFRSQPPGSHIRIGWSQPSAELQACLGYDAFSYSWRSFKGTVFHQAKGKHFMASGFKEGDSLGCLISLPRCAADGEIELPSATELPSSTTYLPPSRKQLPVFCYKHNFFYEEKDDVKQALAALEKVPGSYIEFFLNGVSCGVAFRNLNAGFYHPAVSLFQDAIVHCNFGPRFRFAPPQYARPMCARVLEQDVEQCVSDMMFLVENGVGV